MIITNNSQLMNCQTVEMFTCAYQSVCKGRSVDKTVLKPLLDLTKDVYGKGFSKNMESADDRYHAGFYIKDLPESLDDGECRNKAKDLHELFIYNHYEIDPSLVVDYIDKYFDNLKDNVYTYLLIINLISNTTEWQLPDYMVYRFNQYFSKFGDL